MGNILIRMEGSFTNAPESRTFSAAKSGHAQAVADAIRWLAGHVMQAAIQNDHDCQRDGHYPELGFGVSVNGGPVNETDSFRLQSLDLPPLPDPERVARVALGFPPARQRDEAGDDDS